MAFPLAALLEWRPIYIAFIPLVPFALIFWLYETGYFNEDEGVLPVPAGCRKVGLPPGQTNLESAATEGPWKVQSLVAYPIKSCMPVELDRCPVVRTGLKYDRQFTFAQLLALGAEGGDEKTKHAGLQWKFLTQRECPRLARVHITLWVPDPSLPSYAADAEFVRTGGCIDVRFQPDPEAGLIANLAAFGLYTEPVVAFRIPFAPTPDRIKSKGLTVEPMRIWKETPDALNVGREIPPAALAKLQDFLGLDRPLTLFRIDPDRHREVFRCAPRKEEVGYQPVVGMADAYPLHLLSLASVRDVRDHLGKPHLNPLRFRANIHVEGPPAYAEDRWLRIRIGNNRNRNIYHLSCRTARCTMPNVDPATGHVDPGNQPYRALAAYRRIDPGARPYPCLGMQVVPLFDPEAGMGEKEEEEDGEVEICVGDEVEVLEETDGHFYIKQ